MQQSIALEILKTGQNVFLTGAAGSGKTHVLHQYIDYLKEKRVAYVCTASTGLAASHLDGRTFHSWSGIGLETTVEDPFKLDDLIRKRDKRKFDWLHKYSVLIIDEISMLRADQFDLANKIVDGVLRTGKPFGGMQVIIVGDFFQLPPIISDEEDKKNGAVEKKLLVVSAKKNMRLVQKFGMNLI